MTTNMDARRAAADIIDLLAPHAERIDIAGSVRRGKRDPKDCELVVLNPAETYLSTLDDLVENGAITKAAYGKKNSHRWGEKYRGIVYDGVRLELFCADDDNYGFQLWLRTGPGDANTFIMTVLKQRQLPFSFSSGYGWWEGERLSLSEEGDVFDLLGLPFIEPEKRTLALYRQHFNRRDHQFGDPADYLPDIDFDRPDWLWGDLSFHEIAARNPWRGIISRPLFDDLYDPNRAAVCRLVSQWTHAADFLLRAEAGCGIDPYIDHDDKFEWKRTYDGSDIRRAMRTLAEVEAGLREKLAEVVPQLRPEWWRR